MKRTSIRFRLLIIMILLTTLPIIAITFFASNNTRNSVEKEIISANSSRMQWANQYLEVLTDQLNKTFYSLQINSQLMNNLDSLEGQDLSAKLKVRNYTRDTLSTALFTNSNNIDNLTLYINSISKAFEVDFQNNGTFFSLDIKNSDWSRMQKGAVNMYFRQSNDGIYAFHSINRFEDHALLGGLSVRINKNVWKEIANILKSEENSSVYIINDEGNMLSGSTRTENLEEVNSLIKGMDSEYYDTEYRRTKDYLYFIKRIPDSQLTVVKAIPAATISESARPTIDAAMLTAAIAAAIAVLLSVIVSLHISRPIVSLAKTMKKTQIHEFKEKPVKYHDEIGLLESGYNSMMNRIKELIDVEYKQDIELKSAQIKALQAQINPHFLNNTLNLIGGMALSKNVPEIYEIARVIADLMRYAIITDDNMVSLSDELKHMQNYMFIQKHRFGDRVNMVLTIDETVMESRLPKFTVQPIVENAFEHGLSQKEGSWEIVLRVNKIGNAIAVIIKDNGVGISQERLTEIRHELNTDTSIKVKKQAPHSGRKGNGIGLKNINSRIKLQFGKNYGLRIFGRPGGGTLIAARLPIVEKEETENV